jgi:hypothetical protein
MGGHGNIAEVKTALVYAVVQQGIPIEQARETSHRVRSSGGLRWRFCLLLETEFIHRTPCNIINDIHFIFLPAIDSVLGIDSSASMIESANEDYGSSKATFRVGVQRGEEFSGEFRGVHE